MNQVSPEQKLAAEFLLHLPFFIKDSYTGRNLCKTVTSTLAAYMYVITLHILLCIDRLIGLGISMFDY